MFRKLVLCLAAAAALTACKREAPAPAADAAPPPPAAVAAAAHAFSPEITPADFGELLKTLSSDGFEGRGPGTAGEDKTVAYIRSASACSRATATAGSRTWR